MKRALLTFSNRLSHLYLMEGRLKKKFALIHTNLFIVTRNKWNSPLSLRVRRRISLKGIHPTEEL